MSAVPVTIANDSFDPRGGGSERYLADLARWLFRNGYPVRLFARRRSPEPPAPAFAMPRQGIGEGWLAQWSFSRSLTRHLGSGPGLVLAAKPFKGVTHYILTSGIYRRAFEAERAACEPGLRKTLFPLANRVNAKRRWLVTRQEILLAENPPPRLLVFAESLKNQLVRDFGVPPESILVARPGVDLARFRAVADERPSPVTPDFLFVARNFALKGLRSALLALEQVHRRGVQATLHVAGGGARAMFQRLAANLGLAGFVRFYGLVGDGVIDRLFRECTALVHPTFYDPCSLVAIEALASGCPVITTRCNGASEIIVSGRHGYVLPGPRDVQLLASAMLALSDRSRVNEMRRNALDLRQALDFESHARTVAEWLVCGF